MIGRMTHDELVGTGEAAAILGVSRRTVARYVAAGMIAPKIHAPGGPAGAYMFARAEVEKLRDERNAEAS